MKIGLFQYIVWESLFSLEWVNLRQFFVIMQVGRVYLLDEVLHRNQINGGVLWFHVGRPCVCSCVRP